MLRRLSALAMIVVSGPASGFDYFEHRYLGNRAYAQAAAAYADKPIGDALKGVEGRLGLGRVPEDRQANMAARLLAQMPLGFGDLTALAGDYSDRAEDLVDLVHGINRTVESKTGPFAIGRSHALIVDTRRQWLSACKWIYRTRLFPHGPVRSPLAPPPDAAGVDENACFDALDAPIARGHRPQPVHKFGSEGYRPSREELAEHERIPKYTTLVAINQSHFPRHSWVHYGRHHARALELADCYRRGQACPASGGTEDDLLLEALVEEAFAQHFLHDSFASGHIGTQYGSCAIGSTLFCNPTKARVQQTHDSLNELGLDVRLERPGAYLQDFAASAGQRWTSFGDNHLFIAEADFHREVLHRTALASLREVLDRASAGVSSSGGNAACGMCTTHVFPLPVDRSPVDPNAARGITNPADPAYLAGDLVAFESTPSLLYDLRSADPRVPGMAAEGWKVGFGLAAHFRPDEANDGTTYDGGMYLTLDYRRSMGAYLPNTLGFEFWNVPDRGASFLGTAGYVWPVEVTSLQLAIKAKFGWRTEENFTKMNPGSERRGGLQLTFPSLEATYEVYRPLSLFTQINLFTIVFRSDDYRDSESIRTSSLVIGARFDLSGVR